MPLLKAGIIGCGRIAGADRREYTHADTYARHPGIELVAAHDVNWEKEKRFCTRWKIPFPLYDLEGLDIVSICTPDYFHINYLKTCLNYPDIKAVWCEKPLSRDYKKALDIARRYKEAGKALCVNYQRRWAEEFQRKDVEKITIAYTDSIWTNGCHGVDLILYLLGSYDDRAELIHLDSPEFLFRVVINGQTIAVNEMYDLYPVLDDIVNNRPLRSNGFTAAETTKVCQWLTEHS